MKRLTTVMLATMCFALPQAWAQPRPEVAEQARKLKNQMEQLRQLGMDEEAALMFTLMGQMDAGGGGINPLLLLMMAKGGGDMGEALGMMMFSRAMSGSGPAPTTVSIGNMLLIIDGGTVYKINVETMELEGSVRYRKDGNGMDALAAIAPLIGAAKAARQKGLEAKEKAAAVAKEKKTRPAP